MGLFSSIGKIAGGVFGGPVGGAIGGALGGALDDKKSYKRSQAQTYQSREHEAAVAQREYERQKEFKQNDIQWKVADAKKAGLHPLAVLGSASSPYTPMGQTVTGSSVGDTAKKSFDYVQSKRDQEIHDLNKKNIEADIVLKLAQASDIAKAKTAASANQDQDKIALGDTKASVAGDNYGGIVEELFGISKGLKDLTEHISKQKWGPSPERKKQYEKYKQEWDMPISP